MIRHLLLSCIAIWSLTACNDNEQQALKDAKIIKETKAKNDMLLQKLSEKEEALKKSQQQALLIQEQLLTEQKAKQEALKALETSKRKQLKEVQQNEKLSKIGVNVEGDTITIDTNKTKDFLENIGKTLSDKLKKITQELEKGIIDDKASGVHIDENNINIDLGKTKDFLDTWGQKMQSYVQEFDNMAKDLQLDTTTETK